MELKLTEFAIKLNNQQLTMEELVTHWQRSHPIKPAYAQKCYAYYRKSPDHEDSDEYLHSALWHADTDPSEGERMVPGYFVPVVEYARFGINEAHQEIMHSLSRFMDQHAAETAVGHAVMEALQRVWAPKDSWEHEVRLRFKRAGLSEEDLDHNDPHSAIVKLAEHWTAYGESKAPDASEVEFAGHPGAPTDDSMKPTYIKYCSTCERPDFNGHDYGCPQDVAAIPGPADDADLADLDEAAQWPPAGLFKHIDGGVYEVLYGALSSDNQERVVVYRHRWPFEVSVWTRPHSEWADGRFKYITAQQYTALIDSQDQKTYQATVTAARTARKQEEQRLLKARNDEAAGLAPDLDVLEDNTVRSGAMLYDAEGKKWIAHTPTIKGYNMRLLPAESSPDYPSVWHTHTTNHEGLPLLFWINPVKDLRLSWTQRLLDNRRSWEAQTPFGLLQVRRLTSDTFPWIIHSLFGQRAREYETEFASYTTENSAMRAAEEFYFERLRQAQQQ